MSVLVGLAILALSFLYFAKLQAIGFRSQARGSIQSDVLEVRNFIANNLQCPTTCTPAISPAIQYIAIPMTQLIPPFTTSGTLTLGSTSASVTSASGIQVGQIVTGEGIQDDTTVTAVSGTTLTLSQAANESSPPGTPFLLGFSAPLIKDISLGSYTRVQGVYFLRASCLSCTEGAGCPYSKKLFIEYLRGSLSPSPSSTPSPMNDPVTQQAYNWADLFNGISVPCVIN